MKTQGLIDQQDHEVTWLDSADLSEAQAKDPISYEPGQRIEFHRQTGSGGFRCGELWEVTRRDGSTVYVAKDGKERALPLHRAEDFHVYRLESMPVAVGERVLITKNHRASNLTNGQLLQITAIDESGILLENGRRLDRSKPLHIRQGYTITSQTSQGHERAKMFGFLPVSATSQINAVQMLVSLSRASREVRLYTDSIDVLKEVAVQPGQGRSAVELVEGVTTAKEMEPVDLQKQEVHTPAPSRQERRMSDYERSLWKRAATKYPVEGRTPELQKKIERKIKEMVQQHEAPQARQEQDRSLSHGMGL
jgi:hypothetical protein